MSLKSKNPSERIFHYSEKPINEDYPYLESFYFKIIEYNKPDSIEYVKILKICFIDEIEKIENKTLLFQFPHIPNSISKAVDEIEKLNSL